MTVVYIDLLFLLNLIANYLLLLAAGRMAGAVLARWRIGLGAAAGALYAALIFAGDGALFWRIRRPGGSGTGVGAVGERLAYAGARSILYAY